jgi:hypothetical protein
MHGNLSRQISAEKMRVHWTWVPGALDSAA